MLMSALAPLCINTAREVRSVCVHIFVLGLSPDLNFPEWDCKRYYRMAMMECTFEFSIKLTVS